MADAKEDAFQDLLTKIAASTATSAGTASNVHDGFKSAAKTYQQVKQSLQAAAESATASTTTAPSVAPPQRRVGRRDIGNMMMISKSNQQKEAGGGGAGGSPLVASHWSAKKLSGMTKSDWSAVREEFGIVVQARNMNHRLLGTPNEHNFLHLSSCANPIRCWREMSGVIDEKVLTALEQQFLCPTPIQLQGIPAALQGAAQRGESAVSSAIDLLAVAETGSGKTVAYLAPALAHIQKSKKLPEANKFHGAFCLVIVPNRELALQVASQARKLSSHIQGFRVIGVVGGDSIEKQHQELQDGAHIIVGTPGQLTKLMSLHYLAVANTDLVIIDEADTIVDEGLSDQLCEILAFCPKNRQTLMYTATLLPECEQIASIYLSPRYFLLTVKHRFPTIAQRFELFQELQAADSLALPLTEGEATKDEEGEEEKEPDEDPSAKNVLHPKKVARLIELLSPTATPKPFKPPIIVFVNERRNCDTLCQLLDLEQLSPVVIHGEMRQEERQRAMQSFRNGQYRILVTTDMLARGLDIPDVSLVANFDMPAESYAPRAIVRYIHRIGRTGRAGAEGCSISFITLGASAVSAIQDAEDDDAGGEEEDEEQEENGDERNSAQQADNGPARKKKRLDKKKPTLPTNDTYLIPELLKFLSGCQHPSVKQIPSELKRIAASIGHKSGKEISGAPLML